MQPSAEFDANTVPSVENAITLIDDLWPDKTSAGFRLFDIVKLMYIILSCEPLAIKPVLLVAKHVTMSV